MPHSGHNKKSIADHKRDGTFRPDRHTGRDVEAGGEPEQPTRGESLEDWDDDAQWLWNLLQQEFELMEVGAIVELK